MLPIVNVPVAELVVLPTATPVITALLAVAMAWLPVFQSSK
jgi:hypothetical protein